MMSGRDKEYEMHERDVNVKPGFPLTNRLTPSRLFDLIDEVVVITRPVSWFLVRIK